MEKKILIRTGAFALTLLLASCGRNSNLPVISGTIETDESHVASRYGGRVEHIFAQEGDALTNGQLIAQLDAGELQANRDHAAAQLAEAEAGPRAEEIAAAKTTWESLVAQSEYARAEADRAEALSPQKAISDSERDQAVSTANSLEKSAASAKSQYDLLLAGTRPEEITQARTQLAALDAQLDEMKITAPTDSVLEVLDVKTGDVLPPNQEVATLLLPQQLWVRVYVPETWLGLIKNGEAVRVRVIHFRAEISTAWSSKSRVTRSSRHATCKPSKNA